MSERKLIHHRNIDARGYLREDGLWDIEGSLSDHKGYGFHNHDRGLVPEGEPLHQMRVRLTLDDDLTIVDAAAFTDYSPYRLCSAITDSYRQLIGLRIVPGFHREVRKRLVGVAGCTHITEIVRILATVAWQTMRVGSKPALWALKEGEALPNSATLLPESLKNTCHVFGEDTEVSARVFAQNGKS